MSGRMDFFEVVKNLHPPNQARKRFDRNYSGTGSDNDSKNLYPPNQAWKRYDRNYSGTGSDNDNIPGMHVRRNAYENSSAHHLKEEQLPHHNSKYKSLKHSTTAANFSNKFPNESFFGTTHPPPPYAYDEVHPRTSAHYHRCPSCDYPLTVQVTADLFYHYVSFIPAKRNNETYDVNNFGNESQHVSHGGRTQQYSPVQEPEVEEEEVSTLSNEQTEMMVTAPYENPQQGIRTYASITAGNTIDSKEEDNPLKERDDNIHQKAGIVQLEVEDIVKDKAKETITASEVENITTSSHVVDNGGDGDDDASNDGFTTVVSWKSKIRAKAAARAKEAAAHGYGYGYGRGKNRFGKHGRGGSAREEHNKNAMMGPRDEQHDKNDGGPRGEHDKRAKHGGRGPRDEQNKHGTGNQKEDWQDKHGRTWPRDEHNKHGTGYQKEDVQNKHVRAPWDRRDNYGEFPRERNDVNQGIPREEHKPLRERGHPRKGK